MAFSIYNAKEIVKRKELVENGKSSLTATAFRLITFPISDVAVFPRICLKKEKNIFLKSGESISLQQETFIRLSLFISGKKKKKKKEKRNSFSVRSFFGTGADGSEERRKMKRRKRRKEKKRKWRRRE